MPIQASFPKVADQILNYNKNIVDILTKINSIATTTDPTVSLQIFNENGVLKSYNVPSVNSLKSEIDRLNNNINSMYSIDTTGSLIQTSPNNFKRVITVDLNREPNPIQNLGSVNTFKSTPNWFFDSMLNPMLNVEFDLSGQIEDNVRKVQVRRYIVDFNKDTAGNYTNLAQSALNSFNSLFRGKIDIMKTFETKELFGKLDEMGIIYTVDNNPSPEKIEKLKKSIEKRDLRIKQMVEDYNSGKFDEVIKSL